MTPSARHCAIVVILAALAAPAAAQTPTPTQATPTAASGDDDMVLIPAGRFTMGSPPAETQRNAVLADFIVREQPQHAVSVKAFWLARRDVTRGQFARFVAETGYESVGCNIWDGFNWGLDPKASWRNPGFAQGDDHPVVCVNAADMSAYMAWYGRKMGRVYRLPSEAEWEYAARAGTSTARYWGDDPDQQCAYAHGSSQAYSRKFPKEPDINRACADADVYTVPVGSLRPNAWGLYDMLGDAWQWTEGCWLSPYSSQPADSAPETRGDCSKRAYRGGSWYDGPWLLRAAIRGAAASDHRLNGVGFRLARSPS